MAHCLIFEAASIHEYLTASGRLRHIVGASESIESLCGKTLDDALDALGLRDQVTFSRRAGGVFVAHAEGAGGLEKLARGWSLLVRELLPGMTFKLALGSGMRWQDAAEDARRHAESSRSASARQFPLATPFSARHRATGAPAVALQGGEPVDAATLSKIKAADVRNSRLGERFAPRSQWRDFPLDLSADEGSGQAFPFLDAEQSLALVVADGNGLGQLLRYVHARADKAEGPAFAAILKDFSDSLEAATEAAAQAAVADVVVPARAKLDAGVPMPMRPILLGGDDVAVIIRADLALGFARAFAAAFEKETANRLGGAKSGLPALTASVGIVYFGRRQPIAQVQALTYDVLKSVAKKQLKQRVPAGESVPAAIAWHRLSVSEIGDVKSVRKNDWMHTSDWGSVQVAGLPYVVGPEVQDGLASLEKLQAARMVLESHPRAVNKLREILGLLGRDTSTAVFRYRRWREVDGQVADAVQVAFAAVFGGRLEAHLDLPILFRDIDGSLLSPIGDLLALMAAEHFASEERAA